MSILTNRPIARKNTWPMGNWQREMDNFLRRFNTDLGTDLEEFTPRVEISERNKHYVVRAEVPGMKEKDISVELRDNNLILEGERKTEFKEEGEGFYSSEFDYGHFYRSIPLGDEVNPDSVQASYRDGVLTVELEKLHSREHKIKKIPILKS